MIKSLLFSAIFLVSGIQITQANNQSDILIKKMQTDADSSWIAELDRYYTELSRTVKEGDFEGYKAGYHNDAVIIFASGKNKTSVSIEQALAGWKQGF